MRSSWKCMILSVVLVIALSGCVSLPWNLDLLKTGEEDQTDTGYNEDDQTTIESDFTKFYYNQLTETEQQVYEALVSGSEKFSTKIKVRPVNSESFYRAQAAFMYDNPQFFWTRSFTIKSVGGMVTSVEYTDAENIESVSETIREAASDAIASAQQLTSDYDRVKYFYDYIIDSTDYVNDAENDQDIRSVFLTHQSVCAGYSKAFQYLCRQVGIPCTTVRGTTSSGATHAWNLVEIGGKCYWIDVTWGDPVYSQEANIQNINYNYFCVTDSELFKTHTISHNIELSEKTIEDAFQFPECSDDSLNYYKLNGCYFEVYDRATVQEYITNKFKNWEYSNIEMKFGSDEEYQKAVQDLFSGESPYIETIILDYRWIGISGAKYVYGYIDESDYLCLDVEYY